MVPISNQHASNGRRSRFTVRFNAFITRTMTPRRGSKVRNLESSSSTVSMSSGPRGAIPRYAQIIASVCSIDQTQFFPQANEAQQTDEVGRTDVLVNLGRIGIAEREIFEAENNSRRRGRSR